MKIYKSLSVLIITFFVFFTNLFGFIITPIHQFLFPCRRLSEGCSWAYFPDQFIISPNFKQIPTALLAVLVIIIWFLLIKLSFYLLDKYLLKK